MTSHTYLCLALAITAAMPIIGGLAQSTDSKIKILATPKDPTQETILIGRRISDGMVLQLDLEGAESMWMTMGAGRWSATVTVGVPSFAREMKDKDLWSKPVSFSLPLQAERWSAGRGLGGYSAAELGHRPA